MNFTLKAADNSLFVFLSYALSPLSITSAYVLLILLGAGVWSIPPAMFCICFTAFANYWIVTNRFESKGIAVAFRFLPLTSISTLEVKEAIKKETNDFLDEWAVEIGADECQQIMDIFKSKIDSIIKNFGVLNEISFLIELNNAYDMAYVTYLKKIQKRGEREYVRFIRRWGWPC